MITLSVSYLLLGFILPRQPVVVPVFVELLLATLSGWLRGQIGAAHTGRESTAGNGHSLRPL